MLKKRIARWGLDRNLKLADMLVALRYTLQRQAQGRKSVFLIRERIVTFDDVKRYFRRKGVRDVHHS